MDANAIIEIEKRLLSALMIEEGAAISMVAGKLQAEDFYRPEHRTIWRAIWSSQENNGMITPLMVEAELNKAGKLEQYRAYVRGLEGYEYSGVRAEWYAGQIKEASIRRGLIEACKEIAIMADEPGLDLTELIAQAEGRLLSLTEQGQSGRITRLNEILADTYEGIKERLTNGGLQGIGSGLRDLDVALNGFGKSDVIILAARPSMGKTALAMNIAVNAAEHGARVAVFSLEMGKEQLGRRILSSWSGVNSRKVNTGNMDEEEIRRITEAIGEMEGLELHIDDTTNAGVLEIQTTARRLKHERGLDMIIIDYLQLMRGSGENRQQEISGISRGLKAMARELEIPVLALSQLSRQVEMRAEKKPQLSDLRESGSIEQDADIVMFLYRDEYYGRDEGNENLAELIIAKNRNGPTTSIHLQFDKETLKFRDLTRYER